MADDPIDFDEPVDAGVSIEIRHTKVVPCGVVDEAARVLLPVHYDCSGCTALITVRLMGRKSTIAAPLARRRPVQTSLLDKRTRRKR